jgi:hypothetical protein
MQQLQIETATTQPAVDTKQPPRFFDSGISWPELYRLAQLWHGKRHGRFMPARSDLDPLELKPWLGWLSLVRVVDDGADFVFTIYGTNMAWTSGMELQGKSITALPTTTRLPVIESYRLACRLRRPLFSALIVRNELRQRLVLERVILPLSCDDRTVDRLLIGIGRHEIEDEDVADYRHSLQGCDVAVAIIDP